MVGIILAGGNGSRLYPNTIATSKQLLPVYSCPLIYFPLTFLMKGDVKKFVVITNTENVDSLRKLLKDGSQWGIEIDIFPQENPNGLPEAYIISQEKIKDKNSILILGDNIFYGCNIIDEIWEFNTRREAACLGVDFYNCKIFGYRVDDPKRYGVIEFDDDLNVFSIEEKPVNPKSNYAAVGLYMCDDTVVDRAKALKPSKRGELEITDLLNSYLDESQLKTTLLERGTVWMDAGTKSSYVDAINFVEAIEKRTGQMIACPEEIAYQNRFINTIQLENIIAYLPKGEYRDYLVKLV